jgi:hypothetical protein
MGPVTALSAAGLAVGLAVTGVSAAAGLSASPATSTSPAASATSTQSSGPVTLPQNGVLQHRLERACGKMPANIQRAEKAQTRLGKDASTKGSLAWLRAKAEKAQKTNHPRIAKRIDQRIARRSMRLTNLPQRITKLQAAQRECTTIGLPSTSSPSPS